MPGAGLILYQGGRTSERSQVAGKNPFPQIR
jgi:hypothetical protein